jgi:hypothetical protein
MSSRAVQVEDLARVTPSLLRRADDMCRRRLAREHAGGKRFANRSADVRFAARDRLLADIRLAHTESDRVRREAFVEPADLEPEQRQLYWAGVRGYLMGFGDRPGRLADLGWRTELPGLGVELVSDAGLPFEHAGGGRELRILKLGGRRAGAPLLEPVELRCALVRTASWAPDSLTIVVADLLEAETVTHISDFEVERREADAWIGERVAVIQRNAAHGRPRAGADCNGCAFIAGCDAHA